MKRKVIAVSALLAVLLVGGWGAVQAGPMGMGCRERHAGADGYGCRSQRFCDDRRGSMGHFDRMAEVLGLSEAQQQEITAMVSAEREKNAPLMEKIAAGRERLREVSRTGDLDEAKLRALAEEQAALMSELMVSRVRVKSQIYGMLTPEQQKQADGFGDGWGMGPGCGPRGGCNCQGPGDGAGPEPM